MSTDSATTDLFATFGGRLKYAREQMMLTQEVLAQMCGLTQRQITRYENNKSFPRPKVLKELAKAVDVSVAWLKTGEDDLEHNTEPALQGGIYIYYKVPALVAKEMAEIANELGISSDELMSEALRHYLKSHEDESASDLSLLSIQDLRKENKRLKAKYKSPEKDGLKK